MHERTSAEHKRRLALCAGTESLTTDLNNMSVSTINMDTPPTSPNEETNKLNLYYDSDEDDDEEKIIHLQKEIKKQTKYIRELEAKDQFQTKKLKEHSRLLQAQERQIDSLKEQSRRLQEQDQQIETLKDAIDAKDVELVESALVIDRLNEEIIKLKAVNVFDYKIKISINNIILVLMF
jgi:hypothetical protein